MCHAIELAQEPPGLGARALPRSLRRGLKAPERAASQVEPDCRRQDASLNRPQRPPAVSLQHGHGEGGSGLPDGASVPWLLGSCSAILTKASQNKRLWKTATFCSRTLFSLRVPTETRVSVEYCACAPQAMRMRKAGSELHPAHAWDDLTLTTPNQDNCDVACSR